MHVQPAAGHCSGGGLEVAWASDVGRMRESNQDAVRALPEQGVLIVADGMGGGHAGEAAASMVVDLLPDTVATQLRAAEGTQTKHVEQAITYAVLELSHRLREEGSKMDGVEPLGSTVAMALVRGGQAHIAHMGDSRAYVLQRGQLTRLTRDHTSVNAMVESGSIDREEAEYGAMRGMLSRFVGMGGEARADVRTIDFPPGARLMLCSDGLTDRLDDEAIEQVLNEQPDLEKACAALVQAALDATARDNITVLLAERT